MSADQSDKNSKTDELLAAIGIGDDDSMPKPVAVVHPELGCLAHFRVAGERPDHALIATANVHEAYLTCRRHDAGCN